MAGAGARPPIRVPRLASGTAAAVVVAILGCAGSSGPEMTADGLERIAIEALGGEKLYVRPGHHVGDYDSLTFGEIRITYAEGQKRLGAEEEGLVYEMLAEGMPSAIESTGIDFTFQPGPCVVRVNIYLLDLAFADSPSSASARTDIVDPDGAVTLVFEIRDSTTNLALVRYGDRRSLASDVATRTKKTDLGRLGTTLSEMLEDVGLQLKDVVPITTGSRAERGCKGRLAEAAAGS